MVRIVPTISPGGNCFPATLSPAHAAAVPAQSRVFIVARLDYSLRTEAPQSEPDPDARINLLPSDGLIKAREAIMAQRFTLNVNGKDHTVDADPDMPLLYALRNDVGLNNPHFGCGLAQCGACTVHLDGQAIRSCATPVSAVGDGKVVTLAGLGTPEKPHPLQIAYVEEQVPQCGYCINGWIMTAAAFLRDKKKPTEAEIKTALEGLKCRCGTHMGIMRAVKRAAEMMG